jgi:hypothetical protein
MFLLKFNRKTAVSMQRQGKHTSIKIEKLLRIGFPVEANPRLYKEDPRIIESSVET